MTPELMYLVWVTLLTVLLWPPYIVNRIMVRGMLDAVGYPDAPKPHSKWAQRLMAAHANAVENLIVFAPLVLVAHLLGVHTEVTASACLIYFWARVAHAVTYTFGVPWLRTVSFAIGAFCQIALAWQILAA